MKTLEQIKDEVAINYGYADYEEMEQNILFEGDDAEDMPAFDAIAEEYALEKVKEYKNEVKSLLDHENVLYDFEGDYFPASGLIDRIDI